LQLVPFANPPHEFDGTQTRLRAARDGTDLDLYATSEDRYRCLCLRALLGVRDDDPSSNAKAVNSTHVVRLVRIEDKPPALESSD
jgi:hypothetical protein